MENVGKFFTFILVLFILTIIGGFVLQQYWSWFISIIFNYRQLSLIECIALMYVISLIKMKAPTKEQQDKQKEESILDTLSRLFLFSISYYSVALGMGYIIHLFM